MIQGVASSIQTLINNLSSHDDTVRMGARQSLVEVGSQAVPSLIEALKQGNKIVRWEVAEALGEIKDPKAAPALVEALEDEDFDVRWLAAKGLIQIGMKGVEPLLHALMMRGDSVWLREGADHVIRDLVMGESGKYLGPVMEALEGVEPALQVPAAALTAREALTKAGLFNAHEE